MSHPYDASAKFLVQTRLADWLPLCGHTTTASVEILDSDLSTVTAAADRVLRILENPAWLLHLELQSSRDSDLLPNLPLYNALLQRRHGPPVRTVVVLLRRSADSPEMTGVLQRAFPGEPPYLTFQYQIVRLWQLPVDMLLSGGLGIVPLAPLGSVVEADLPAVIARMERRIAQEATPEEIGTLWTAADVLMGLRYPRALVDHLLGGIHGMKDSVTYQGIVEEGMIRARQEDIIYLGRNKFGAPSEATEAFILGVIDLDRLTYLIRRLPAVSTWDDLLSPP
jgi:hypothetical protein